MKRASLDAILADRASKRTCVMVTELGSGEQWLLHPDAGDPPPAPALASAIADALTQDRCRLVETPGATWFVQPHQPPVRIVLVGAVHIAHPLARKPSLAGFEVIVVDPRTSFATSERFPNVSLSTLWPDEALGALGLDPRTAVVTLTHDPKLDDPALAAALRSPCFYVGSLGSKKTHAARLARLREAGFGDSDLARIHGPAGLSIGARSPAEIAVSMLAEIVRELRSEGSRPDAGGG